MRFVVLCLLAMGWGVAGCLGAEVEGREPLYRESLRPQFHFTARYWDEYQLNPPNHHEGWINDLNGLVYNQGEYHLFAQRWWSAWLHAVSRDLIHWEEMRPAFGKGGPFGGTQSGGGVVDVHNCSGLGKGDEPPMIAFWSSTDNLNQCISYSLDRGRTWTKYEKNPVLVHPYRDPRVFWYEPDQKWVLILYGPSDEGRRVLRYGFNGEENDAHDLRAYNDEQWMVSVVRVCADGQVVVNDTEGRSDGRIDIGRLNIGTEAFYVGAKANGSEYLKGEIGEVLVYDRVLSDEETEWTLGRLRTKWGLCDDKSDGKLVSDGLVMHLDGGEGVVENGGRVTGWRDLSGLGHDVKVAGDGGMPGYIENGLNGRPVVRFEGGQVLRGPAVLGEGDDTFTMVALWRRDRADGSQVVCEQNIGRREAGRRTALLTVCREERENVYLLFESRNLLEWKKLDSSIPNSFECPDMFVLPVEGERDRKVWVVIDGNGDYVTGQFDGKQFTGTAPKRKGDYGRNFYATMTFENMPKSDPRRIQLAWMRGWDDYPKTMPFNQQVSFPCELTLRQVGEALVLCRYPIDEIKRLYRDTFRLENQRLRPGENPLAGLEGELFDISMTVDVAKSKASALTLHMRGNEVRYDITRGVLASVGSEVVLTPRDGLVEIRVLMDRLSIESYGNRGEVSITNIAYQQDGRPDLALEAVGGEVRIVSLVSCKLGSMWVYGG